MDIELVWAAGFFDGEGTVAFYPVDKKNGKISIRVRLGVRQNDRRPLDRFQQAVGVGKVYGPYQRKKGELSSNPYYVWEATKISNAFEVIHSLLPYLSEPKKEQIWDNFVKYQVLMDENGVSPYTSRRSNG